jgi:hypothetical protein
MALNKQSIHSVNIFNEQIIITFHTDWFQEDITTLSQLVFIHTPDYEFKEKIIGADREDIRFMWNSHEFMMNFDCYSQSCWINAIDQASLHSINLLYKTLSDNTNHA